MQTSDQMGEQIDDLGLVSVDLLVESFDLLVQVADLEAYRGEVGLDDPELTVVLLLDLETPGQGSELAVSDGVPWQASWSG
ncbi:hypothetical protein ABZY02_33330 [Streptomyces sp. NPDC006649]|uniref:hypothetical protein n=1 Tax=Streptomyces sp. NPDC006649 TaxID=3156896 RepID=UPI0033B30BA8